MKKTKRNILIVASSFASLFALTAGLVFSHSSNVKEIKATSPTIDLSTLSEDYTAQDGDILTGTLSSNTIELFIANDASVTLRNVNIPQNTQSGTIHPGISLLGNATIILEEENTVYGDNYEKPSIMVPEDCVLTIQGTGILNAPNKGATWASSIGGAYGEDCGSIIINSGTINATGGRNGGAAIGGPVDGSSGDITINGGTLKLISTYAACIGSGFGYFKSGEISGGDITINGGEITCSSRSVCIGAGQYSTCGNITINDTVTSLYLSIEASTYTIGYGDEASCGTITLMGEVSDPITTNPYIYPVPPHTHDWSYVANGASITASCSASDCPITTGLTLTLEAPTNLVYDGSAKVASFADDYSDVAFGTPSIEYYKNNSLITECVNVGTYEARVTVGGATAKLQFEITKATPTGYVVPTGLAATYGDTLSSVTLPEHWAWKNPNDKVGNAGERTHIAIYTPENPNYKAVEENVTISVSKANPTYVIPDSVTVPYDVALSTIGLPERFSWMDGTQKTTEWGLHAFKAKYTPSDTENYNIVENIDITLNVKWILTDPTEEDVIVTIKDGESEYNADISVKVEVKAEITVEQKRSEYADIGRRYIKPDEDINEIYSVKLIKKVGTTETEIQPSDIKEGTKIIVSMPVPTELVGQEFRLLEIYNSSEAKEFSNSEYAVTGDGKTLMVEVDRMGEFAFISHTDTDNGFIYTTTTPARGISPVAVVFIVLGVILLVLVGAWALMMFVFNKWIRKDDKAIRVFKLFNIKKDDKFLVVSFPVKFEYKLDNEIFNTKEEALK